MIATQHTSRRVGECVVWCGRKSKDSRAAPESPYALSHVWWEQEEPRVGQCCSEGHKPGWDRERKGQAEGPTFGFVDWLPGSWSVTDHMLSWLCSFPVSCANVYTHSRSRSLLLFHIDQKALTFSSNSFYSDVHWSHNSFKMTFLLKLVLAALPI